MAKNLDTARDILEKALDSLVSFAGESFEKEFRLLVIDWYESKNYWEAYEKNDDRNAMDIKWKILLDWLAAREEKQKEAIKALDIEKLIKLIREA